MPRSLSFEIRTVFATHCFFAQRMGFKESVQARSEYKELLVNPSKELLDKSVQAVQASSD
jgi:hypothetical protein